MGNEALHTAVKKNDIISVNKLLLKGENVSKKNSNGLTPI